MNSCRECTLLWIAISGFGEKKKRSEENHIHKISILSIANPFNSLKEKREEEKEKRNYQIKRIWWDIAVSSFGVYTFSNCYKIVHRFIWCGKKRLKSYGLPWALKIKRKKKNGCETINYRCKCVAISVFHWTRWEIFDTSVNFHRVIHCEGAKKIFALVVANASFFCCCCCCCSESFTVSVTVWKLKGSCNNVHIHLHFLVAWLYNNFIANSFIVSCLKSIFFFTRQNRQMESLFYVWVYQSAKYANQKRREPTHTWRNTWLKRIFNR